MRANSLIRVAAVSLAVALAGPALAQVQLDHDTAQQLSALGIDTSQVTEESDVGYINQILASDADDATKKAQLIDLIEKKQPPKP